jgi:undecaprenyl-diphosphatase
MLHFLFNLDHSLFCIINSHHSAFWDGFFQTVTWLGNGWIAVPLLLAITIAAIPKKKYLLFFVFASAGMIISSAINTQTKDGVQRARPIGYFVTHNVDCPGSKNGTYSVHVVGEPLACRSFPSGHTNTAFCAAAVLAFFLGGWYWFAFVPAFLVAYSRVYMGVHFPMDAVAGAGIALAIMGITVAGHRCTVRRMERR